MIAYACRQLKDFEKNYSTHDLELAVVVFTLKMWRHYWYSVYYDTYTDHKNLKYIFTQKGLNTKRPGDLLQPLNIPEWKREEIMKDFMSGSSKSLKSYDSIWVIVDQMTR